MKKKLDLNQLAKSIVEQATGEIEMSDKKDKDPVAINRGKKRMETLTQEQRSELGRKARKARAIKEALTSKEVSANASQLAKKN